MVLSSLLHLLPAPYADSAQLTGVSSPHPDFQLHILFLPGCFAPTRKPTILFLGVKLVKWVIIINGTLYMSERYSSVFSSNVTFFHSWLLEAQHLHRLPGSSPALSIQSFDACQVTTVALLTAPLLFILQLRCAPLAWMTAPGCPPAGSASSCYSLFCPTHCPYSLIDWFFKTTCLIFYFCAKNLDGLVFPAEQSPSSSIPSATSLSPVTPP